MICKPNEADLLAENNRLKAALAGLICWAGECPDGPEWATPEAKARNRAMFNKAMEEACKCFPQDYNGFHEIQKSN